MKFDTLCSIILEGNNLMKTRVAVVNPNPTISIEDVLRDPSDPEKGVRTYLDAAAEGESVDHERAARRSLRRVNWVVKSMIKRMGSRDTDIHKLLVNIIVILEKYLRNVMRFSDEQIESNQLAISKEAAFIGKLMLPPNNRMPNAKGVFGPGEGVGVDAGSKKKEGREPIADLLHREFGMSVDEYLAAFDPDLIGTIKAIIKEGPKAGASSDDETFGVEPEASEEIAKESFSADGSDGVSAVSIMKDPRIRGIYDPRIVRKVLKSMIEMGSVILNADKKLILPEEGAEGWREPFERAQGNVKLRKGGADALPTSDEESELAIGDDDDATVDREVEPQDDESDEGLDGLDDIASQRLGYKPPKHGAAEEEVPDEDEDPDDAKNKWR